MKSFHVLVVCSANKGRSASFEACFKHILHQTGTKNITISSGGEKTELIQSFYQDAQKGTGAEPMIRDVLNKLGIHEIEEHKTTPVSRSDLEKADLVLAYNTNIRDSLKKRSPHDAQKITTVREFVMGEKGDLPSEAYDVDDSYHPIHKLYRNKYQPQTYQASFYVVHESQRLAQRAFQKIIQQLHG